MQCGKNFSLSLLSCNSYEACCGVFLSAGVEIQGSVSRQEMKNYGTIDQRLRVDLFNCFIKSYGRFNSGGSRYVS